MSKAIKDAVRDRYNELKDDRSSWLSLWQDIKDYCAPDHGRFLVGGASVTEANNADTDSRSNILDSRPEAAVEIAASGLMSGMTSPARPWFRLGLSNKELAAYRPVKHWLDVVTEQIRMAFHRSNVYDGLHHSFLELVAFGTSATMVLEDYKQLVRLRSYTVGEYCLGADADLRVDTFALEIPLTARAIVQRYGEDRASERVKDAMRRNKTETRFLITQLIEPNDRRVRVNLPPGMSFRSIVFDPADDTDRLLSVSGFNEFPMLTPRWKAISNDVYGRGRGAMVLADAKMLMEMKREMLIAVKKMADPPVVGTNEEDIINTLPGGVSYPQGDPVTGGKGIRPMYEMRPEIEALQGSINETRMAISEGLYNQLFLMIVAGQDDPRKTATEIVARNEEKMTLLGPVLERVNAEKLDVLLTRTFNVMMRRGEFPPPPPELAGMELEIEYISTLAQAQKILQTRTVEQLVTFAGSIATVKPDVLDKIKFDKTIERYADDIGVPAELIADDDEVAFIREQRARQEQAAQQVAALQTAAGGAKDLADAKLGTGSVLDSLLGGSTGAL